MRGSNLSNSALLEERDYLDKLLADVVEGYATPLDAGQFYSPTDLATASAEMAESRTIASSKSASPVGDLCGKHANYTSEKRVKRDVLMLRRNRKRWLLSTLYIMDQRRTKLSSVKDSAEAPTV